MNDQALAILSGAVAQLNALETSTQALIDADTSDVADQTAAAAAVAATAQAKIDADNAAIATSQTGPDGAEVDHRRPDRAHRAVHCGTSRRRLSRFNGRRYAPLIRTSGQVGARAGAHLARR